jgi:Mce-associated membrane protein
VPGWVLGALAALLVVVLVGVGLLLRADRQARAVDEARGEAVRAARTAATAILSYDYRHLDADFAKGRALTTSPFAQQYAKTTADAVQKVATDTKASVVAEVAAVGVEQASEHRVVVVLFVNQTTTSTRLERPQVDQNRVEMTMVERDGRWLVSQVSGL